MLNLYQKYQYELTVYIWLCFYFYLSIYLSPSPALAEKQWYSTDRMKDLLRKIKTMKWKGCWGAGYLHSAQMSL